MPSRNMLQRSSITRLLKVVEPETNKVMANFGLDSRFEIKPLTSKHKDETIELLAQYYINDSVMQYIPGLKHSDIIEYLSTRYDHCIKQNYSVGVFRKSGNPLIALSLNYVKRRLPDGSYSSAHSCTASAILAYDKFMAKLDGNLYDRLKTDKLFHAGMTAVHADYRKLGLSGVIEKCCIYFGVKSGCDYMVLRPTMEYLIKSFADAKCYVILNEMKYADYIDPDSGSKLFPDVKFPHVRVQSLCIDLKKIESEPIPFSIVSRL